jgi:hypothetical protein
LICPKCGEDNSDNFRFCGMCGNLLEARRPAGAPVPNLPRIANAPEPLRPLHQPGANQPGPNQSGPNQPSLDSLRETAFSGLDSFFEPEQPKSGGRRIVLLLALLAALGGAGWWTYTNYLGATESRKPEAATSNAGEAPAEKPSTKTATKPETEAAAPAPDAGPSQAVVSPAAVPASPAEGASAGPEPARKTADAIAKPAAKPMKPAPLTPRIALGDRSAAKREPSAPPAKAAKLPEPAAADTGDAAFRKGEAYLYGRGVPENCDEAVKNLKAASAKSNAKARSAFGTMYATGHCVARDLPTSYLWFAMALRADPNNQILEKDLSAVWNQMTPPERQMATRMKQ